MPTHDIIDNPPSSRSSWESGRRRTSRTEKLVDHPSQMLATSERARFVVG